MIEATIKDIHGIYANIGRGLIGCRVSLSYIQDRKGCATFRNSHTVRIMGVISTPKKSRIRKERYIGWSLSAVDLEDIETDEFGED